jgi:hypothetical protein
MENFNLRGGVSKPVNPKHTVKVMQSRYMPGVAQRFPGS